MAEEITLSDSDRVTARRQIATQIAARILSGDLGAGRRLPSGRAMARRLRVHRSVVTEAYRQLSNWGLVRTATGSGVYVAGEIPAPPATAASLRHFLEARRMRGSSLADTAELLSQWIRATGGRSVLVVERETALRRILAGELEASLRRVRVRDMSLSRALKDPTGFSDGLVVARRGLIAPLQMVLPPWLEILPLRFRPASAELLASGMPPDPCTVALCTRSRCLGDFARGLLASAHGDRVGLLLFDPADAPAVERARRIGRWIFSDSDCAPELLCTLRRMEAGSARVRVVRLISPRFISELSGYFGSRSQSEK